ncbi:MAG: recombinase family protein [Candidatus Omnitrophica bacterium]|nr:recombinase family protein [Candidatus Omnitrophota bacterium]
MKDEKKTKQEKKQIFCAIYTRVSTAENLEQEFTSLDAQRESAESYILSQKSEGWFALPERYDDAGYTGANTERLALQKLISDIKEGKINCVVVYKVDRLSRSLLDFSQLLEFFEQHNVAFVSVTQNFNTNTSMGRLTLNILLSFAQFEREIISERTRDKMGAAKKKGKWIGGRPPLGYDLDRVNHKLVINPKEAKLVRKIFDLYLEKRSLLAVTIALNEQGFKTKSYTTLKGKAFGGIKFKNTGVQLIIKNVYYTGKVKYHGQLYQGEQEPILSDEIFQKAQEILAENRPERKITQNTKNIGLLSDILRCKNCNSSMYYAYSKKGKYKYHYYLCMNAQKRGYKSCPTRLINAQAIENMVIDCLKKIANDIDGLKRILKILNKESPKEKTITIEKLKDALMVTSPLWETFSPQEKRRIFKIVLKEVEYDAKVETLGITLHENGLKFICTNIDFGRKDKKNG